MLLNDIMNEVFTRLHTIGTETLQASRTGTEIVRGWINMTYQEVQSMHPWPWLLRTGTLRTISGTQNYALGSDVAEILDVRDIGAPDKLEPLDWLNFDEVKPNPNETSAPKYYLMNGVQGVQGQLGSTASTVAIVSANTSDTAVLIHVYGIASGELTFEAITSNGVTGAAGVVTFSRVDWVTKANTSLGAIRVFAGTGSAGTPVTFAQFAPRSQNVDYLWMSIFPMGAATLSYRYKKRVWDMANTVEAPELPAQFHEVLIWGALVRGGDAMEKEKLILYKEMYDRMLVQMKVIYHPSQERTGFLHGDGWPGPRPFVRLSDTVK